MRRILLTGGVKSGKSRLALALAQKFVGKKVFIATAEAFDDEMKAGIARHQEERSKSFFVIEEPAQLAKAIQMAESSAGVIVIDCLTVWVNNLLYHLKEDEQAAREEQKLFLDALQHTRTNIIVVTNEVGSGILPENALARKFIYELGILNQKAAQVCDEVIFMVSGIPQRIKGTTTAAGEKV
ncbi:MAG: hypothetical protein A2787_08575 [Omnitrophica WOR_2 bacterium RIFCSPHIGHO2_01_FULL_48_9]|nr:MAG: hypothetical protein A3D10_03280 [Omnitrophica WOR_2 bacterium RIFCSPHIGHO2_02_FULL_48_11]OGX34337.1 MAG: hypothetical protein A2787_08575 [Omnitrophica WOR_2 bacterium RIFCSPHIGHO2_01_FULL_48_9]